MIHVALNDHGIQQRTRLIEDFFGCIAEARVFAQEVFVGEMLHLIETIIRLFDTGGPGGGQARNPGVPPFVRKRRILLNEFDGCVRLDQLAGFGETVPPTLTVPRLTLSRPCERVRDSPRSTRITSRRVLFFVFLQERC